METLNNYQQQQITGQEKQTVIVDSSLTAETDELDPKFNENDPATDPENPDEEDGLDGEGIPDDFAGEEQESDDEEPLPKEDTGINKDDDVGLNHDGDDDLSLNT